MDIRFLKEITKLRWTLLILGFPIAVIVQVRLGSSESEAMLGIVDYTEVKSQKDQVVTSSKPSKPLLT